jgi:hypothetical protein
MALFQIVEKQDEARKNNKLEKITMRQMAT